MIPRYFTWGCTNCDDSIVEEDCVCEGKYCALDEQRMTYSGREIIYENLRQKCIHQINGDKWWDYISKAHKHCYTDFTEDCSRNIHQEIGIDWRATNQCVEDSFSTTGDENLMLEQDAIEWVLRGPHFVPAVVINKMTYRGTLDPENVFNSICESFKDPQDECQNARITYDPNGNGNSPSLVWFFIAIFFIIGVNVVILVLCRRCSNRDMKQNVNSAIADYMKLRSDGNKASD